MSMGKVRALQQVFAAQGQSFRVPCPLLMDLARKCVVLGLLRPTVGYEDGQDDGAAGASMMGPANIVLATAALVQESCASAPDAAFNILTHAYTWVPGTGDYKDPRSLMALFLNAVLACINAQHERGGDLEVALVTTFTHLASHLTPVSPSPIYLPSATRTPTRAPATAVVPGAVSSTGQTALLRSVVQRCGRQLARSMRGMLTADVPGASAACASGATGLQAARAALYECSLELLLHMPSAGAVGVSSSSSGSSSASAAPSSSSSSKRIGYTAEAFLWITDEILVTPRLRDHPEMHSVFRVLGDGHMAGWAAVLEKGLDPLRVVQAITGPEQAAVLGNFGAHVAAAGAGCVANFLASAQGNGAHLVCALTGFIEVCPVTSLVAWDHLQQISLSDLWHEHALFEWGDSGSGQQQKCRAALAAVVAEEGCQWQHGSLSAPVDMEGLLGLVSLMAHPTVLGLLIEGAAAAIQQQQSHACFDELVVVYGTVLSRALAAGPQNRHAKAILNSLAFNRGASGSGAMLVEHLFLLLDQAAWALGDDGDTRWTQGRWRFYLLCIVLQHQLRSIDDEEFHGRCSAPSPTLPLAALATTTLQLNGVLHRLYWSNAQAGALSGELGPCLLVDAATTLYRHLHARNERCEFVPASDLTWTHVYLADLTPDYRADTEHVFREPGQGEEGSFRDPRAHSVLTAIPHVIDFKLRVEVFNLLLAADKSRVGAGGHLGFYGEHTVIHRSNLVADGFELMQRSVNRLKGRLQVSFVSEQGTQEAGIDGGGLFKEFVEKFIEATFAPGYGLWTTTPDELIIPNTNSGSTFTRGGDDLLSNDLYQLELLGKLLGKVMYESILVDMEFSNTFLTRMLGHFNHFNDLVYLDEDVYRSLLKLKHLGASGQDLAPLGLTFEVAVDQTGCTAELVPGGADIAVTKVPYAPPPITVPPVPPVPVPSSQFHVP